jgi:hypothetical protein
MTVQYANDQGGSLRTAAEGNNVWVEDLEQQPLNAHVRATMSESRLGDQRLKQIKKPLLDAISDLHTGRSTR